MCLTFSIDILSGIGYQTTITTGAYDDPNGSHISIEVTSSLFEGKRPVQRQQLVYKALWEGKIYFYVYMLDVNANTLCTNSSR